MSATWRSCFGRSGGLARPSRSTGRRWRSDESRPGAESTSRPRRASTTSACLCRPLAATGEAEPLMREALEISRAALGAGQPGRLRRTVGQPGAGPAHEHGSGCGSRAAAARGAGRSKRRRSDRTSPRRRYRATTWLRPAPSHAAAMPRPSRLLRAALAANRRRARATQHPTHRQDDRAVLRWSLCQARPLWRGGAALARGAGRSRRRRSAAGQCRHGARHQQPRARSCSKTDRERRGGTALRRGAGHRCPRGSGPSIPRRGWWPPTSPGCRARRRRGRRRRR